MTEEEINNKLQVYQHKKNELEQSLKTIEKEIIIQEERIKQVQENLISTYGTSDEKELKLISEKLEKEVLDIEKTLENDLEGI